MAVGQTRGGPLWLPELPVVPREYHEFYRTPRFRWWHSLVALALFALIWAAAVFAATIGAVLYEVVVEGTNADEVAQDLDTPAYFLANNIGVACAIPAALFTHRIVFGQRPGWLFSVQGRVRWGALGRFLALAALVHLVVLVAWLGVNGAPEDLRIRPETWFLLAIVLLTTPLQAAGEEVAFRGLGTRAIGSWFASPRVGLLVATLVTAWLFMLLHGADNAWLNVFYLCLAVAASGLTWRTGGLEAAVALHVVVNLTTMLFLPFLGLEGAGDRGPGADDAQTMAQVVALLLSTALLWWQAQRVGLPVRTAPADREWPGPTDGRDDAGTAIS